MRRDLVLEGLLKTWVVDAGAAFGEEQPARRIEGEEVRPAQVAGQEGQPAKEPESGQLQAGGGGGHARQAADGASAFGRGCHVISD